MTRMTRMTCRLGGAMLVSLSVGTGCGSDSDQPTSTLVAPVGAMDPATNGGTAAPPATPEPVATGETPDPTGVEATPGSSETPPVVLAPSTPADQGGSASPVEPAPTGETATDPAETPTPTPAPAPPVGPEPDAANLARCTGVDPISCHFGGAPGNYFVTVVLGGAAAARTQVLSETRRVMLAPVATAAGETRRLTFGVNVRQPEGEPIQAVPAGTPGLDLYFRGSDGAAPAVSGIGFASATAPFMIYVAGDSTVADQTGVDYGGWAQQLPQYFDYPVVVSNYSDSGESSGSFLNARPLFGTIEANLRPNDWVLIQFGHNDKTVTAAQFHDNMTQLVTRVKAKAAFPLLLSPVSRAQFTGQAVSRQHVNSTGANLPQIVAQVAAEQNVPFVDLTGRTTEWLTELGPTGWQAFHALGTDVTHTNDAGAAVEAGFVRDLIVEANLMPLVSRLR